jgi:hypothetical protein
VARNAGISLRKLELEIEGDGAGAGLDSGAEPQSGRL